ncbi:kinase-like protein [Xylona heveae TC161]|uniref:Kinase-like protein n=1 Tax=Xylona heveae (strain CBS 132557 / TC161) TaxID=1328760 RepID=A0A165JBX0_XYLHT|nr:kinase-like protein [Xylona heveae TC161]KZF26028.1 kinase-like protein [Xylona heveae TC161]
MDNTTKPQLLMIGMGAITTRTGDRVCKKYRILDDDAAVTKDNISAMEREANVYLMLGTHPHVAECLFVAPSKEYIELRYYPKGNLRDYRAMHAHDISDARLEHWAYQMIDSIAFIHSKGVRHADIRLDQWLVDEQLNARLCDFNGCGHDGDAGLGLPGVRSMSLESSTHFLPRDPLEISTVGTDLFALGSALYELVTNHKPFVGLSDDEIEVRFRQKQFPCTEGLLIGRTINGCWQGAFASAVDVLDSIGGQGESLRPNARAKSGFAALAKVYQMLHTALHSVIFRIPRPVHYMLFLTLVPFVSFSTARWVKAYQR